MKRAIIIIMLTILMTGLFVVSGFAGEEHARLLYMGQASIRIVTIEGKVIYIDPFAGDQYDLAADLILITHGHRDHTLAAPALHEMFPDAAVYIHELDKGCVGIYRYPMDELIGDALKFYDEGDTLPLGTLTVEVLLTPGHTGGSVCLKCGNALFTGDTLFAGSMGRIDLPGAQPDKMMSSLARLAKLEGDYDVYPGHMEPTTMARERQYNLYIKMLSL